MKQISDTKIMLILLITSILLSGAFILAFSILPYILAEDIDMDALNMALAAGRLAPIPDGARNLRVGKIKDPFGWGTLIRFQAPPDEIEAFLAASESLKRSKKEVFSTSRMFLPKPEGTNKILDLSHMYFTVDKRFDWFYPEIRKCGRKFDYFIESDAITGQIIIDDEKHTVFIRVTHLQSSDSKESSEKI